MLIIKIPVEIFMQRLEDIKIELVAEVNIMHTLKQWILIKYSKKKHR